MGQRRDRLDNRLERQILTRQKNSVQKQAAANRRDARMMEVIKSSELPYTPDVMSWLSAKLDKKASRINQADVKQLMG